MVRSAEFWGAALEAVSGVAGIAVPAWTKADVKSGTAPVAEGSVVRGCPFAVIAAFHEWEGQVLVSE